MLNSVCLLMANKWMMMMMMMMMRVNNNLSNSIIIVRPTVTLYQAFSGVAASTLIPYSSIRCLEYGFPYSRHFLLALLTSIPQGWGLHWESLCPFRGKCWNFIHGNATFGCILMHFLPRCMECRRGLAMRIPSVCPSVCPSNA